MCEDPSGGAGCYKDISGKGHHGTPVGTWTSGDRLKQGRTWVLDPNGTDAYINLGDSNDFSFGDGSNDSHFTVFGMFEVVDSGGSQRVLSKYNSTTGSTLREWFLNIDHAEKIVLLLVDNSVGKICYNSANNALSVGKHSCVVSYNGVGGATAANGITIYVDGVVVASTATNDANYVAMENLNTPVFIGSSVESGGVPASFMKGDFGCLGIDAVEWSAMDARRFHQLCLAYYSENGSTL